MPPNSVRPANQAAPRGAQNEQFATVFIMSDGQDGVPGVDVVPDGQGAWLEEVQVAERITAHVQFFGTAKKDGASMATYSTDAFELARRLPLLLELSRNVILCQQIGLGYEDATPARDLSGISDKVWESRGSVDLTFAIISREQVAIAALAETTFTPGLRVLEPDGTIQTRTL